jgi:beta-1,4-mannosyltransferase
MLLDLRHGVKRLDDVPLDAADALRTLQALGHPRPILIAYHPPGGSPVVDLLYARAIESGVAAIPIRKIADAAALVPIAAMAGARVVLHLHWVGLHLVGAGKEAEAAASVRAFASELDGLRAASVDIAWTIHNVLPHDTELPDAQIALRREIVSRASVIHVMAKATEEAVGSQFTIPGDRILRVGQPALTGMYPDWVGRTEARRVLTLPPDAPVIALVGALRPYKGLAELLDALPVVARRRPRIRLVIGGSPSPGEEMERLLDRAIADPRILIHPRRVPDDRLQHLMRGADVVVLPYRRVLNSAALFLALTFERPVVFPRDPVLQEFADPDVAVTYERGDPGALAAAIDAALDLPQDRVTAAARAICARHEPAAVSRAFAEGLRDLIER